MNPYTLVHQNSTSNYWSAKSPLWKHFLNDRMLCLLHGHSDLIIYLPFDKTVRECSTTSQNPVHHVTSMVLNPKHPQPLYLEQAGPHHDAVLGRSWWDVERATCEWNLGLQQVLSQGNSFPNFRLCEGNPSGPVVKHHTAGRNPESRISCSRWPAA